MPRQKIISKVAMSTDRVLLGRLSLRLGACYDHCRETVSVLEKVGI